MLTENQTIYSVYELRIILEQPTLEMQRLRMEFMVEDKLPTGRTWECRLKVLPEHLLVQIAAFGAYLLESLKPWAEGGTAAAIDSTILTARGGVWHKKDREAGVVPHSSLDTEAHWYAG